MQLLKKRLRWINTLLKSSELALHQITMIKCITLNRLILIQRGGIKNETKFKKLDYKQRPIVLPKVQKQN